MREAVLFIHLGSMAVFFMILGIEWLAIWQLGRVSDASQARTWLTPLRTLTRTGQISMVLLLLTGMNLAEKLPAGQKPGFLVTLAMFLVIGAFTGIASPRLRKLGQISSKELDLSSLSEPFLEISIRVRVALTLGIVFLVSAKPDLTVSLIVFVVSALIGAAGSAVNRKPSPA